MLKTVTSNLKDPSSLTFPLILPVGTSAVPVSPPLK